MLKCIINIYIYMYSLVFVHSYSEAVPPKFAQQNQGSPSMGPLLVEELHARRDSL